MDTPIILAHGALGPWDELMFLGVGAVFLVMMGISWVRSRNTPPEIDESADPAAQPTPDADAPDHFRLE